MNIDRIRQIIIEEINNILNEAPANDKAKERLAKEKDAVDQQKSDFNKQKLDFNKKKFDYTQQKDKESDKEEQEKDQASREGGTPQAGAEAQPDVKPNISFKDQGEFYEEAYPELRNLSLGGSLVGDDERRFVALAIQAAQGRFDNGFMKFLSKGRAGNVYGKDFSNEDKQNIIDFCKEHELVR